MILITGAAGFIGSALAWALNRRGRNDLVLVDRFGSGGKWKNIVGLRFRQFVDRTELFEQLATAPWAREIEAVFHIGACTDTTLNDADFFLKWNYEYSCKLCEWSLARDICFLYASSAAVYGDGALGFSDEPDLTFKLKPMNAYGLSKWMFDKYILENDLYRRVAGFRFFNVFGPNEYHKGRMASVIFHTYPQARDRGVIRLFESHRPDVAHGEQKRDFIYIEDVLDAMLFVFDHPECHGILNVGSGYAHSFNELAAAVFAALGKPVNIEYFPMPEDLRERYQYHTCANLSRLQNAGFSPPVARFTERVKHYVSDYLSTSKYLSDNQG